MPAKYRNEDVESFLFPCSSNSVCFVQLLKMLKFVGILPRKCNNEVNAFYYEFSHFRILMLFFLELLSWRRILRILWSMSHVTFAVSRASFLSRKFLNLRIEINESLRKTVCFLESGRRWTPSGGSFIAITKIMKRSDNSRFILFFC